MRSPRFKLRELSRKILHCLESMMETELLESMAFYRKVRIPFEGVILAAKVPNIALAMLQDRSSI